jgi:predicted enzyme related to lactoylglutathione lyase
VPTRDRVPIGAPCWADLWTSDVDRSRRFYGELFGWEAQDPSPEFGGYFMFHRDGVPVAGGMGAMGSQAADDTWKIYLAAPDLAGVVAAAPSHGGEVMFPPTPVADLGRQCVLADASGATVGGWEAGTFPGFTLLDEPGAPGWFELRTRHYDRAVEFYRSVFGCETEVVFDSDELRYTVMVDPADRTPVAGVVDAAAWLPEGSPSHWTIYWGTSDTDASVAEAVRLGGALVDSPMDTPYGRMATLTDPMGAEFRLRTPPAT